MKNKRLTLDQIKLIAKWVGEGLQSNEICAKAAKLKEPFKITPRIVQYYRKKYKADIAKLRSNSELKGLNSGLAKRDGRVEVLTLLANAMIQDLLHDKPKERKIWVDRLKAAGAGPNFRTFIEKEFNGPELAQLRGVLADIAEEVGERRAKIDQATPTTIVIEFKGNKDLFYDN